MRPNVHSVLCMTAGVTSMRFLFPESMELSIPALCGVAQLTPKSCMALQGIR